MGKWMKEKNIVLRLVSIVMAVVMWLYIVGVENPENDVEVRNINLVFSGLDVLSDRSLTIVKGADTTISLRVRGRRSNLAKIVKNETVKAGIDVSDITSAGEYNHVYDITLPSGISILDKSPYFVKLTVDTLSTAYVNVKVKLEGNIASGYLAKEPVANPLAIKVTGPQELVSAIDYAQVVLKRENLDTAVTNAVLSYSFIGFDGQVIESALLSADVSQVTVNMEVLKTKTVPLSVNFVEGGGVSLSNLEYSINPESIELSGSTDVLDGLNQIVLGTVDLSRVMGSEKQTFQILLPNDVTNLSGVTQAELSLSINDLKTQTLNTDKIELIHVPEGFKAKLITKSLPVLVRGAPDRVSLVKQIHLRAVVDLEDLNLPVGQHTVTAQVYLDGFADVGVVVGEGYKVAVEISKE